MTTVLFACVHNAGRSQMAAALFNRLADGARARAISAGTRPAARVHPEVVAVMREVAIDLADGRPHPLTAELAGQAQWLITMGCGDECPVVAGAAREDWPLDDPHGKPPADVRRIRDEILQRVAAFIDRHGWRADGQDQIEPARPADAPQLLDLLRGASLPTEGLVDHLDTAVVARRNGRIVGSAALEVYADGSLLRSVAVDPALRGTGLGRRLTDAAIALAVGHHAPALYLLTTTAESYFPRFGFTAIGRDDVPAGVRGSVEFTSACPASAIVMRKELP
jgi:arsenate reductase